MASIVGLIPFVTVCLAAVYLGAVLTRPAIPTWYAGLKKPSWTPPNSVFPPIWITLYVLMAVSAWLVWREAGFAAAGLAFLVFGIQLALSVVWSLLFFRRHQLGAACAEIVLLWVMILATMILFGEFSRLAAWLLAPYLLWVAYAALLNFAIWRANSALQT